jgi:hypothetical protein
MTRSEYGVQDIRLTPSLVGSPDRDWGTQLWTRKWHGQEKVTRGRVHRLAELDILVALDGGDRLGAATYRLDNDECELVSLNAVEHGCGVGTALLTAVERAALASGTRLRVDQAGVADHHERQPGGAPLLSAARLPARGATRWRRRRRAATDAHYPAGGRRRNPSPRRPRAGAAAVAAHAHKCRYPHRTATLAPRLLGTHMATGIIEPPGYPPWRVDALWAGDATVRYPQRGCGALD